jgi:hypothetical protein
MGGERFSCSPEGAAYFQDELMIIDWAVQAAGCAEMYDQTGDPDYELMRAYAEVRAEEQARIFQQIAELERLTKL